MQHCGVSTLLFWPFWSLPEAFPAIDIFVSGKLINWLNGVLQSCKHAFSHTRSASSVMTCLWSLKVQVHTFYGISLTIIIFEVVRWKKKQKHASWHTARRFCRVLFSWRSMFVSAAVGNGGWWQCAILWINPGPFVSFTDTVSEQSHIWCRNHHLPWPDFHSMLTPWLKCSDIDIYICMPSGVQLILEPLWRISYRIQGTFRSQLSIGVSAHSL